MAASPAKRPASAAVPPPRAVTLTAQTSRARLRHDPRVPPRAAGLGTRFDEGGKCYKRFESTLRKDAGRKAEDGDGADGRCVPQPHPTPVGRRSRDRHDTTALQAISVDSRRKRRKQTVTEGPARWRSTVDSLAFDRPTHATILALCSPSEVRVLSRSHAHPGLGTYAWTRGRACTPWLTSVEQSRWPAPSVRRLDRCRPQRE
jgi:hypothetical protein